MKYAVLYRAYDHWMVWADGDKDNPVQELSKNQAESVARRLKAARGEGTGQEPSVRVVSLEP